jgi:ABC-type cobalamin/Fe3+-siderophores transport system ATPase subunit
MFPISSISLNFGASNEDPLTIQNPSVTVFVGPNNSGKSLLLRELAHYLRTGQGNGGQILRSVALSDLNGELGHEFIRRVLAKANVPPGMDEMAPFELRNGVMSYSTTKAQLQAALSNPLQNGQFLPFILRTLILDGATRLNLVGDQQVNNLVTPMKTFERLITDDEIRRRLRSILFEAFKKYLVIDASTSPGQGVLRYASNDPASQIERSFSDEAIKFFRASPPVQSMSDGVRAFTGILIELFAGDPSVLLIDEPEAFLHPTLAFLLGRELSRPAKQGVQKNVFIATHSASFLMGCIQSGANVNIVRLTHANGESTARLLDSDNLRSLMRNPLLRSVGAIEALFYDYVVVVESDSDRAFYDEINNRLLAAGDPRGISNCLFLRAQNKQTVPVIMKPLRKLGIPAAGIVDVDIYEEGGQVWDSFVDAAGMSTVTREATKTARAKLKTSFDNSRISKPKENGGINVLTADDQQSANDLFDQLEKHGLFVVRHGEMENWLPGLVTQNLHGSKWLVEAFEAMGEDPRSAEYLKPATGDVWDFTGNISKWLRNPTRKGV